MWVLGTELWNVDCSELTLVPFLSPEDLFPRITSMCKWCYSLVNNSNINNNKHFNVFGMDESPKLSLDTFILVLKTRIISWILNSSMSLKDRRSQNLECLLQSFLGTMQLMPIFHMKLLLLVIGNKILCNL